jgi:dsRNA-specific ribonuclease
MMSLLYNPYNTKNRLFTKTDIHAILSKNGCNYQIQNHSLFQTAMVHSSYVKRTEYTLPSGETTQLADKPANCLDLFENSYETLEHLGILFWAQLFPHICSEDFQMRTKDF